MPDYGPMQESVERLMIMADQITEPKVRRIAAAYRGAQYPRPFYATIVAAKEGRMEQTRLARRHASMNVHLRALLMDFNREEVELVARAASNASLALATEDLIGCMSYGLNEYGRLVEPWFTGFGMEREEAA